jgi:hypothetical protein
MACVRSAICSLVKMFEMWLRTVLGLTNRSLAILALLWPWAMRSSTSRSRAVSSGKGSAGEDGRGGGEKVREASGDLRPEIGVAFGHGTHDLEDLGGVRALQDVALRPGAHGGENRVVVLEHGQDHDPDIPISAEDTAGCFDAVHVGHLYVHQDYVRPEISGPFDHLFSGGRLAHDLHVGFRTQHEAQPFPEDGVIVSH